MMMSSPVVIAENMHEQEARLLLSRLADRLMISQDRIETVLGDHSRDFDSLVRALLPLQLAEMEGRIAAGGGETVCLFAPRASYSTPLLDLAAALEHAKIPHLLLSGDIAAKKLLARSNGFYCGRSHYRRINQPAVFVTPNLTDLLPRDQIKVHVIHDILDTPIGDEEEFCRLGSCFDYFLVPSKPAMAMLLQIFERHSSWRAPVLVPMGYLRLDQNLAWMRARGLSKKDRIVYAPTVMATPEWRPFCTAYTHAVDIVQSLLRAFPDDIVVFRPHPHSVEAPEVRAAIQSLQGVARVEIDLDAADYMKNYARAKLLVTDISGTAYTFAFTTLAPVLFVSPNEGDFLAFDQGPFYREKRGEIGAVATDMSVIGVQARKLVEQETERAKTIAMLRDEVIYHIGDVSARIVAALPTMRMRGREKDWILLGEGGGAVGHSEAVLGAVPAQQSVAVRLHDFIIVEWRGRFLARKFALPEALLLDEAALAAAVAIGEVLEAGSLGAVQGLVDAAYRRDGLERKLLRQAREMAAVSTSQAQAQAQASTARAAAVPSPSPSPSPPSPLGGAFWPQPKLLERGFHGHNLVGFENQVFAIRIGYGPVDIGNPEDRRRILEAGYLRVFCSEAQARLALSRTTQ